MRKANAIISALLLVLFLIHGIAGGFQLLGWLPGGLRVLTVLARAMVVLLVLHAAIGIKLTADAVRKGKKSGAFYARENRVYWTRRISGLALMVLIAVHVVVFLDSRGEVYRLTAFGMPQLVGQILMVLCLLVHILINIRPLLISFGIGGFRIYIKDVLFVLSVVLLFGAAAFAVYYLRWNVLWRVGG